MTINGTGFGNVSVPFHTDTVSGESLVAYKIALGDATTFDGYVSKNSPLPIDSAVLDTLIDNASATVTYVCEAPVGTATSAAAWRVARHTVSGNVTIIRYAGTGAFNQIADNRASLTYA